MDYLNSATVLKRLNTLLPTVNFKIVRQSRTQVQIAPTYGNDGDLVVVLERPGHVFAKAQPRLNLLLTAGSAHAGAYAPRKHGKPGGYCHVIKLYPPNVAVDFEVTAPNAESCHVPQTQQWELTDQALTDIVKPRLRNLGYLTAPAVLKQLNRLLPGEAFKVAARNPGDTGIMPTYQTYGYFDVYVLTPRGALPGATTYEKQPISTHVHVGNYKPYGGSLPGGQCYAVKLYPPNLVLNFIVNAPDANHCRAPHNQQWQGIDQALDQVAHLGWTLPEW